MTLILFRLQIGGCCNLSVLSLRDNQLTDLPMDIGKCEAISVLDVAKNRVSIRVFNYFNLIKITKNCSCATCPSRSRSSSSCRPCGWPRIRLIFINSHCTISPFIAIIWNKILHLCQWKDTHALIGIIFHSTILLVSFFPRAVVLVSMLSVWLWNYARFTALFYWLFFCSWRSEWVNFPN